MILADDIGWADFKWNNGTANTPRMDEWRTRAGSILMQDSHSSGTVCSPTRASVLTGRTPLRDCINGVYGCSDMTECVPNFEFAPQRTFTIGDAARAANKGYVSQHWAKWHLGSFFNDSEKYGGLTSSPITHGFDHFNSTVEVAPTGTTNCQCKEEWAKNCIFGHNTAKTHCGGGPGPDPDAGNGCCFNYWWNDPTAEHGIMNLSNPIPPDETLYISDSFDRFLHGLDGKPFVAQLAFHNCHIPYVGTQEQRWECGNGTTCTESAASGPLDQLSSAQLDFYACLNELDAGVGRVLDALDARGYGHNTLTWLATDNGPEENCDNGICNMSHYREGPGVADPLRGRKRDVWEGGHRIPSIVSWPAVVQGTKGRVSWEQITTSDFLTTIMEVLDVQRPAHQADWTVDGRSILPLLSAPVSAFEVQDRHVYAEGKNVMPIHPMGWMYNGWNATDGVTNLGFRYGHWKFVHRSKSSTGIYNNAMLFDLSSDLGERDDVSSTNPEIFTAIQANFSLWYATVLRSIVDESKCVHIGPSPPPAPGPPSSECSFIEGQALSGGKEINSPFPVASKEDCCGYCHRSTACAGAAFHGTAVEGHCTMRRGPLEQKPDAHGGYVCVPTKIMSDEEKSSDEEMRFIVEG